MNTFPEMKPYQAVEVIDRYDLSEFDNHECMKMIDRYAYCQRWQAVAPYKGSYEEQPKEWLEFDSLMSYCKTEYLKYQRKLSESKSHGR